MDIAQISQKIAKEKACIDDLIKYIAMHTQKGRLEQAARLGRDLQNSIKTIQKLEQQRLYITAKRLAKQGIICGVINKHVQKT